MKWYLAIDRICGLLLGIMAWLFAEIGLTEGGTVERASKRLYRFTPGRLRKAGPQGRRLRTDMAAPEDLSAEALRLERPRARLFGEHRLQRESPLRAGRPPGFRQRIMHEVDEIMEKYDWFARNVQPDLDSS